MSACATGIGFNQTNVELKYLYIVNIVDKIVQF